MSESCYALYTRPLEDGQLLVQLFGDPEQLVAPNLDKARSALRNMLLARYRDDLGLPEPLHDARLSLQSVSLRPVYTRGDRRFPAPARLSLRVPVVTGSTPDGDRQAWLPDQALDFYYYAPDQLRALVRHFVEDWATDRDPAELARQPLLPAPALAELSLHYPPGSRRPRQRREVDECLPQVAEALPAPGSDSLLPEAAWTREDELQALLDALAAGRQLLVVGPSGAGKTTLLLDAARRLHQASRKDSRRRNRPLLHFWRTDARRLAGNARYFGEWQEQLEAVCEALEADRQILWLDDLVTLASSGGSGPEDSMAAYLLPALKAGRIQVVAEITPSGLDALYRLMPGLVEPFHCLHLAPMSRRNSLVVAARLAEQLALKRQIVLPQDARQLAWRLLERFQRAEAFPGKLVRFLVRAAAQAAGEPLDAARLRGQFTDETGLPAFLLDDAQTLEPAALSAHFAERLLAQPEAVAALADVVMLLKAGLNDPDKPVATLLFAGPTGVGKTAAAQALAAYLFGHGLAGRRPGLLRLDMSEFQHPAQMHRLIGDARRPGKLVAAVRARPCAVVLLDEIEKAHPAFFDALMNLLDAGRLTDALGRVTDFRNVVLVMTSNLGAAGAQAPGFVAPDAGGDLAAIRQFFRPEFVNRIDRIVQFRSLGPAAVADIARRELAALASREGLAARGLRLGFSEALVAQMASAGFDARFGARPLQRLIEAEVVAALTDWLLANPALHDRLLTLDHADGQYRVCLG